MFTVVVKVCVTFGFLEVGSRLHSVLYSCFRSFSAILLEGVKHLLSTETLSHENWKNCQDDSVTNINTSLARCWFPSAFLTHLIFSHSCQSTNCSSICDYWGAGVCKRTVLFPRQTTDCIPIESSKSIKTIFFHWMTEVFLADCREQGPGKVRKSIMCVHLCFTLKQTLTACWTAWPCWHFIFHLASSINHSTPIQCDAHGHPPLLALIIPLRRKMYS